MQRIALYVVQQLATPSTHLAIAAFAAAMVPVLPHNWGLIAAGVFGLLGIAIPEAGEKL